MIYIIDNIIGVFLVDVLVNKCWIVTKKNRRHNNRRSSTPSNERLGVSTGAGDGNRTRNLLITNQLLYH